MRKLKILKSVLLMLTILVFAFSTLEAQENENKVAKVKRKAKQEISKYINNWGDAVRSRLEIRVADMKSVCELNDEQVGKLQFAAKGAVTATKKEMKKQADAVYEQMFGEGGWILAQIGATGELADELADEKEENEEDEDSPDVSVEDEDEEDDEKEISDDEITEILGGISFMNYFDLRNSIPTGGMIERDVEKQPVWKKAVAKVLTEDQTKKYKAVVKQRNDERIEAATTGFIGRVDRSLVLTAEQKKKLFVLVKKEYGKKLLEEKDYPYYGYIDSGDVDDENDEGTPFTEILTPQQTKIWNMKFRSELSQLDSLSRAANEQVIGGFF